MRKGNLFLCCLIIFSQAAYSQDCRPTVPVISAGGSTIICEGGSVSLSTSNGNDWTQRTAFGGSARVGSVGFSIAAKGYIGTGADAISDKRDFWEYDPVTDAWTQKANFGGVARRDAVGFGTATKGYIGTGYNGTTRFNDFWEYDPGANTWISRTNFPGGLRSAAVGFCVGTLGYIGTGTDGTAPLKDFYSYNPATNVWTARADFGGTARLAAVGYGISTVGYIGTGFDVSGERKDFWQYSPSTNTWLQRADFGGGVRTAAFSFSIGTRGYIGAGMISSTRQQDFWEYNPSTNTWTKRANFGGGARTRVAAFSIGGKGYAGVGATAVNVKDFWEYEPPLTLAWSTGATTASIPVTAEGYYSVTASNHLGCSYSSADVYVGISKPEPEITPGGTANICTGGSVLLTANNSNVWTLKTSFGGVARRMAVGFSIGNKGYTGTGFDGTTYYADFWEYDPDLDAWTQKATLATARSGAVGFSIGSKGYIGTGGNASTRFNDFWEYDPGANTWTARANFAGTVRRGAVGFSIRSKGYIGTGENGVTRFNDFWEYDPVTNAWEQKTAFTGTVRSYAAGFSIGSKGYIGTGANGATRFKDFWEYDQVADSWIAKTDFGGTVRDGAIGFSIAAKGYIGNGYETTAKNDFWQYDPVANSWVQKADFAGGIRDASIGFSIGAKGYVGTGWDAVSVNKKDFWEYDPGYTAYTWSTLATTQAISATTEDNYTVTITDAFGCNATSNPTRVFKMQPLAEIVPAGVINICPGSDTLLEAPLGNKWTQKSSFAGSRNGAVGFSIGKYGYLGTGGAGTTGKADFWEFDPSVNTWTQKASLPGPARIFAVGFSLSGKGYIGTGLSGVTRYKDFWEFDPVANNWVQKADFGGTARSNAVGFSVEGKGYIGTGNDGAVSDDFWVYDPRTDIWKKSKPFPGTARQFASALTIGSKAYVGLGINGSTRFKDFWEFDPVAKTWTARANFGGTARDGAASFSIGTKGYIGTGNDGTPTKDFWEYNPILNNWVIRANLAGSTRAYATGFSVFAKGYFCLGFNGSYFKDVWEYDPSFTYSWSGGQTTSSITVTSANNYSVTLTDALGCSATSAPTTITTNRPPAVISPSGTINTCAGTTINLAEISGGFEWKQKTNVGGEKRWEGVGFSIGSKGYIGTGLSLSGFLKDFWEYDPATNAWTQKVDFGGDERSLAVGFSIGSKGYIGTGHNSSTVFSDFWEYDPTTNTWLQKADCGGGTRYHATGFSMSTKGFIGFGIKTGVVVSSDFWEYDPVSDTWTARTLFPGIPRAHTTGFGLSDKCYIGGGFNQGTGIYLTDFWEYDPTTFLWTQKADIGGGHRCCSFSFCLAEKGYIGSGFKQSVGKDRDFWEYDPTIDTWTRKADVGGSGRARAPGFVIDGKGYVGTGANSYSNDFWAYGESANTFLWSSGQTTPTISVLTPGSYSVTVTDIQGCTNTSPNVIINHTNPQSEVNPAGPVNICAGDTVILSAIFLANPSGTWTQKANVGGVARTGAVAFSIGDKGYIGTGYSGTYKNDFWEYNSATNAWAQKANVGSISRTEAVGFSIGNKGYIGTGYNGSYRSDFLEYDPIANTWTAKANFGGGNRGLAVGFSIGSKGYIGTGFNAGYKNDFWEYDPVTNVWVQKANFGGTARQDAAGFNIGEKGYIGTGYNGGYRNDFWEYDPVTNSWVQKTNFGGGNNAKTSGFTIGSKGYFCTGGNGSSFLWAYDPALNTWVQKATFPGGARQDAVGFSINNKGYLGTGYNGSYLNTFWQYDPQIHNLLWSTGDTTTAIAVTEPGNYTVTVTAPGGCSTISPVTVMNVNSINTWAGGGTNNWNTATNWSCGKVPNNPKITAVINNGAVPMPVMTADVVVKNLVMNGASTVDINGNTFSINGTITGTGNLKGSSASNLILKGTAGTVNFASGSNTLKDLLLTDTATATLGNALNITAGIAAGTVTVNNNAVLSTNNNLTLKSDAGGTASVGLLAGSITGNVTVERYINTGLLADGRHGKSWQLLATPTTSQSIKQSWQENAATPAGFGTIITGTGTGFDITTVLPSIKTFNAANNNWDAVTNTNNALQQKLGYMIFVRGDRSVITSAMAANPTTLRSKGVLFQPTVPAPSVAVAANKFQTFGNPYASRIEFSKVRAASTGIDDVFYVWDPLLSGTFGYGGYQTITGVAGYVPTVGVPPAGNPATIYYPAGVAVPYIESGQAVFVKGNSTGGNVNFNENIKATGSRLVNRGTGNDLPAGRSFIFSSLFTSTGDITDGNIVAFENGLSNEVNGMDAAKMMNPGENFGIMRNDSLLAVEARNNVSENDTVFYRIQNLKQLPYQFRFAPVNMPAILTGYLIDRYTNTSTPISMTDSSFINFAITADASSSTADRFILIFRQVVVVPVKIVSVTANRNQDKTITVNWKAENEINIDQYDIERSADGRAFVSIGQAYPTNNNGGSADYNFKDVQPLSADNFYRIKAIGKDGQVQYSAIVKVSAIKINTQITVYPNPIIDNKISIRFANQQKGNYMIQLTNKLGQLMYTGSIYVDQNNTTKTIQPNSILASGTYQLNLLTVDGKKITETIIVP